MKITLVGSILGVMLSVLVITGCAVGTGLRDSQNPDRSKVSQNVSEREGGGSESEHSNNFESNESSRGRGISVDNKSSSAERGNESSESGEEEHRGTTTLVLREGGNPESEHGGRREGDEIRVDRGSGNDPSGEDSHSREETDEAAMSSPVIPLGQSWNGVLGGFAVSMQYDAATQSVHGTVRNTLSQKLCHVQAEPHMKSGTKTVGEIGPDRLGHLNPGQEAMSRLTVASEPKLAGVSYDGYVVHMEVFECGGPGPAVHSVEEGIEGSGASVLGPDETFDAVLGGARLILNYEASNNSFNGTVENTTIHVLERVRVEVHLSNGTELGPTAPTDLASGEVVTINLPATLNLFTGWTTHVEVGIGEEGSESGEEHRDGDEEHGEHDSDKSVSSGK